MIVPIVFGVLIRPDPVKKRTASGLEIVTDEKMEENATVSGKIVAIGPDTYTAFKPSIPYGGLKVGQRVAYARYAGMWIKDPETNEKFLMVNDEDIKAVLVGGEEPNDILDPVVAPQKA